MDRYRGREVNKYERTFWDRFPDLLIDDSEQEPYNSLIAEMRKVAVTYFARMREAIQTEESDDK